MIVFINFFLFNCSQETKKLDALYEEMRQLKLSMKTQREENERLRRENQAHSTLNRKNEHLLCEQRKHLDDVEKQINVHSIRITELEAELEAEQQITQRKRNALDVATEEISKANSIIVRQSRELTQLSNKVDWRTDVALQQEQRITFLEKENQSFKEQLKKVSDSEKENVGVANQLQDLREVADEINRKYNRSKLIEMFCCCEMF